MTPSELIQGVIVRVAIVGVPLSVMVLMSLFDIDVLEFEGWEIRVFSMFSIPGILHFAAYRLGWDHPAFLWVSVPALFVVALFQYDVVPGFPALGSISFMSLLGIVAIHYPFAIWLLAFYQKKAKEAEYKMAIIMDDLDEEGGE